MYMTQKDNVEEWEKEFKSLTPEDYSIGDGSYGAGVEWLKTNPHLYDEGVYSEPLYTLNKEKVICFIHTLLTEERAKAEERVRAEMREMMLRSFRGFLATWEPSASHPRIFPMMIEQVDNRIREATLSTEAKKETK